MDWNKDIFYNAHKFNPMYMYLRQASGRRHRTQEPFGSTFNALPLSYFRLTQIKKDRRNGEQRKGRVFIEGAEL